MRYRLFAQPRLGSPDFPFRQTLNLSMNRTRISLNVELKPLCGQRQGSYRIDEVQELWLPSRTHNHRKKRTRTKQRVVLQGTFTPITGEGTIRITAFVLRTSTGQ